MLKGKQLCRAAFAGLQVFGVAAHHLLAFPASGLHDGRQIEAARGHVLGEADARGVAGECFHDRGGEAALFGSLFYNQPDALIGEAAFNCAALPDRAEECACLK